MAEITNRDVEDTVDLLDSENIPKINNTNSFLQHYQKSKGGYICCFANFKSIISKISKT